MRKIYSLVLMTAMLFIGANAWADNVAKIGSTEYATFEAAWQAAQDGNTIQLIGNVTLAGKTLWLGTATMNDANPKSITLDLNGYTINAPGSMKKVFFITHGSLNVITSVPGGTINHDFATVSADSNYEIFRLAGSTYKNVNPKTATSGYFTHLTIGNGVTLQAKSIAITIDKLTWPISSTTAVSTANVTIPTAPTTGEKVPVVLSTQVYPTRGKGTANGVRVDIYGAVRGNKYAIKTNGNLGSPTDKRDGDVISAYYADPAQTITYTVAAADTAYSPFVHLHSTADMWAREDNNSADKKPVAVYCSGYSRWLIEGTCMGSTAVYVKSGDVDIQDAVIASTYEGTYTPPTGSGSGTQGQGSGIVIESNEGYSGDIDVNIGGDTKVTAQSGYAIDEKVTTSDTTKVEAITITGGSFEGGQVGTNPETSEPIYGTISISETTAKPNETGKTETVTVVVSGGSVEGNVTYGNEGNLSNIVDTENSYTTTVTDPTTGKQTVVISQGEEPEAVASDFNVDTVAHKIDVKMDDAVTTKNQVITGTNKTVTLGTLTMNPTTTPVTLTVNATNTLIVDKIIMGYKAQIIVEPGASLIVMGEQGITAPAVDNIILKASETAQATFLFNPSVSSNRQPNATVQLYTPEAKQIGAGNYKYQRITTPLSTLNRVTNNASDISVTIHPASPYSYFGTWIYYWNYNTSAWTPISAYGDLKAFNGYQLTNNSVEGGVTYNFEGNLQGSVTSDLNFVTNGFNIFANSYTAPIHIKTLLNNVGVGNIDASIHLWNATLQRYEPTSVYYITAGLDSHVQIPAMQNFVLNLTSGTATAVDINYTKSVWEWVTKTGDFATPAPERSNNNISAVRINVMADNGDQDYVMLVEDANLSDQYETGVDIEKYMNEGMMNMYVMSEQNLAAVGTDNLVGTMLSLQTTDAVVYTLTFNNVMGEELAIRDNVTNTVTLMSEGASYRFVAEDNAMLDGRFQIVSRQEMPTAVETIEETVAPKAIYTIMGQYVGETTDWNNLPAGVYVVDGVKVVK